jgi:transcriptional regulator with XRE-family HTH domain
MHQSMNDIIRETLEKHPFKFRLKLADILKERGITQNELHRLTGIRIASINELVNFRKNSLNITHLIAVMIALRIDKIEDIIEVEFDEKVVKEWKEEMKDYKGGLTPKMLETLKENTKRLYGEDYV